LLHANTGIGLKHMIEAVNSSENQEIRGVLLSVFTETLSRRVDLNFGDDDKSIEESYEDCLSELLALVISPDRELVRLLGVVARSGKDATLMASALLKLFEDLPLSSSSSVVASSDKQEIQLLEWAIRFELSQTSRLGSLFRSESMSTKLMGTFFASRGGVYLRHTLRAPVQLFLDQAPSVEVDPHKGAKVEDIEQNTAKLLQYTELFLETIVTSAQNCPKEMKHVLYTLRKEATLRFAGLETEAECERVSIAGYMFLRFFCPAIAMPTKFELVSISPSTSDNEADTKAPPTAVLSRQCSRGLLLIAKILQNLANGTHFFEECMSPLNSWIDDHLGEISKFTSTIAVLDNGSGSTVEDNNSSHESDLTSNTDDISRASGGGTGASVISGGGGEAPNMWINEKQVEVLTTIHTFMYNNNDRMEKLLFPQQKVHILSM